MKHLINRFTNTIKAFQLLSDPDMVESLYNDMKIRQNAAIKSNISPKLGTNDAFYHKHFIVQIVN